MRAAIKPLSFPAADCGYPTHPVSRLIVALVATLALLVVWRPTRALSQEANGRLVTRADSTVDQPKDSALTTHIVRGGETLWGLAARFYGDGHQWPALARRNRIAIDGPAPLRVGMRLRVPAVTEVRGANAGAVAAAPADSTVPSIALAKAGVGTVTPSPTARTTQSLSEQTGGTANAPTRSMPAATVRSPKQPTRRAVSPPTTTTSDQSAEPDTSRVNLQSRRASTLMVSPTGTRIGLVDLAAQEASRKSNEGETVFHRDMPDAAEAERRMLAALHPNTPAPRQAEFDAAPFTVLLSELSAAGAITKRVGSPEGDAHRYPQRAILTDQLEVRAPSGTQYAVGQRLVAFTTRSGSGKQSAIAIPSGIVEIVRVESGRPILAVLSRQSGRVEQGQRLLPATGRSVPWLTAEKLPDPDVHTAVRWVDPGELQPTLQSFVMLSAGTSQGVKAGDEFGLYRSRNANKHASESLVAKVRVVRSEATGSSAIITSQFQSDIGVGLAAHRLAKAP